MLTSVLRKLKLLTSRKTSPRAEERSAQTLEQREESKMQNAEFEMQNVNDEEETLEVVEVAEAKTEKADTPRGELSHLSSSVPRAASLPKGAMTKAEMREMREILGDVDDAELHRLYKRVTN